MKDLPKTLIFEATPTVLVCTRAMAPLTWLPTPQSRKVDNAACGYWTPGLNCNDGSNFDPAGWAGSAKIVTSQDVIAVGRPHLSNGQVVVYNGFTNGGTAVYVPFLFRKFGSNEAALYIQNLSASDSANTTITYFDEESGFYCTMDKVVQPGASGAIWLAGLDSTVCVP
jgi:hypothetical protein